MAHNSLPFLVLFALCAALAVHAVPAGTAIPSDQEFRTLVNTIDTFLLSANAPRLPTVVRLNFHDCVGGCDGCISTTNAANNGLAQTAQQLTDFYNANFATTTLWGHSFTRADFWALAGMRAAWLAANTGIRPPSVVVETMNFRVGRVNCLTAYNTDEFEGTFPTGLFNWTAVKDYFGPGGDFGYSNREIVALMGTHALGRARPGNSGFAGRWTRTDNTLDNAYFAAMSNTNNNYQQAAVTTPSFGTQYQWNALGDNNVGPNAPPRLFMLNADMALLKSFAVSANGQASCTYASCTPNPDTASIVQQYVGDNLAFLSDWGKIYSKLLEHGYTSSQLFDQPSPSLSASPSSSPSPSTSPSPSRTPSRSSSPSRSPVTVSASASRSSSRSPTPSRTPSRSRPPGPRPRVHS